MQTVHSTSMGVDAFTGRNLTGVSAGKIQDADVGLIEHKIMKGLVPKGKEALMPVYDTAGMVIGYERSIDPEMIRKMNKNDHLGEMIGAWAGRHVEEAVAQEFNNKLVRELKKMWNRDKGSHSSEYIDLSDPKQTNQIEQDAWKLIPKQTKEEIKRVFGDEGFMVRKSELDNAVGYRGFSIGEAWAGPSKIKPTISLSISIRMRVSTRSPVSSTNMV
ncbi:hypothetical protein A8B83_02350 [Rhodobacteraceae bacterium EhC02]|nr:hypothetical protein A8B83_02350 [Rhodobacteraceae bacterium EhC02]